MKLMTTMTTEIKPNSRSFIWLPLAIIIVCCLLASSCQQSQAQPQQPISGIPQQQQQQQQHIQQPQFAINEQQQQHGAAAILASIVNSAQQQQQQQPFDVANQQQQSILNAAAQFGSSLLGSQQQLNHLLSSSNGTVNYREQGEILRQEILRRAGHLQKVVASSHEMIKNSGDLIVSRLLEQLNHRLNVAKSKADKIINEPTTNEVALRALGAINQGLNNVNNIIQNIVNQNRSKLNLQQLSRQFSTALSAVQKQLNTQQQQQQQQLT